MYVYVRSSVVGVKTLFYCTPSSHIKYMLEKIWTTDHEKQWHVIRMMATVYLSVY